MQIQPANEQKYPITTPQDTGNIVRGVGSGQKENLGNNMTPEEAGADPRDTEVKPKKRHPEMTQEDAGVDPRDTGKIANGVKATLALAAPGVEATPLTQAGAEVSLPAIDSTARGGAPIPTIQE